MLTGRGDSESGLEPLLSWSPAASRSGSALCRSSCQASPRRRSDSPQFATEPFLGQWDPNLTGVQGFHASPRTPSRAAASPLRLPLPGFPPGQRAMVHADEPRRRLRNSKADSCYRRCNNLGKIQFSVGVDTDRGWSHLFTGIVPRAPCDRVWRARSASECWHGRKAGGAGDPLASKRYSPMG
jgi:hypothetical protein